MHWLKKLFARAEIEALDRYRHACELAATIAAARTVAHWIDDVGEGLRMPDAAALRARLTPPAPAPAPTTEVPAPTPAPAPAPAPSAPQVPNEWPGEWGTRAPTPSAPAPAAPAPAAPTPIPDTRGPFR